MNLVINNNRRLVEDIGDLCHRLHDCSKCKLRFRCRWHFDHKLTGEKQPADEDVWRYLLILTMKYRKSRNGKPTPKSILT